MAAAGTVQRVEIRDEDGAWPGPWHVHTDDLPHLERLEAGDWQPRTTLLSPFDNLICDRARTEQLFGFRYRIEIYVPAAKHEYGYYVLPILHGDRLIGRLDPRMDRQTGTLHINAVWLEAGAPDDGATTDAVTAAIEQLAEFLGAEQVVLPS